MSYSPKYLYGNGDLITSAIHRDLLRDLCEKLYKQFYPWRIKRFCAEVQNYFYATIMCSDHIYISIKTDHNTGNYDVQTINISSNISSFGRFAWDKPIDNDYIIEDIITLLSRDNDYIKFMEVFKRDTLRDELLKKISIEVDYHPDSPVVELLKSDFDSMK